MTPATALALFEEAFDIARAKLEVEVDDAVGDPTGEADHLDFLIDEILEDAEPGPKAGCIVVERAAIEALRIAPCDSGDVFQDFDWEMRRALNALKAALVREVV